MLRSILTATCFVVALISAGPVAGQAGAVPVAARDLPRGVELAAGDIRYAVVDDPRGGDADVAPGWTTRRVISEGEPLRPPAVVPPVLVDHGDPVDVVVRRGAVLLRLRGTALGAAALGDDVTVRIDSRRRIRGVAAAPGIVQINGATR